MAKRKVKSTHYVVAIGALTVNFEGIEAGTVGQILGRSRYGNYLFSVKGDAPRVVPANLVLIWPTLVGVTKEEDASDYTAKTLGDLP